MNTSQLTARTKAANVYRPMQRRGIVLLVVLGMLTLFSILAVSYLVFTSRQRQSAGSIARFESSRIDASDSVETALEKLLVGSNGPETSIWGSDLLGDLYGMRDGVEAHVAPPAAFTGPSSEVAPAVLLNQQFLRFPSLLYLPPLSVANTFPANNASVYTAGSIDRFSDYPFRRNDVQVERRYPGYSGAFSSSMPLDPTVYVERPFFSTDDELNGRLLTFRGGPLEGMTFPIAKYFGDHRNASFGRSQLSGQVVLDIREYLQAPITIEGRSRSLSDWLGDPGFNNARLFYDYPTTATALPTSAEPYASFYLNGRMLNGPGLGWDRPRTSFDTLMGVDRKRTVGTDNPVRPFNLDDVVSVALNATVIDNGGVSAPVSGVPYQVPTGPFDTNPTNQPIYNGTDIPSALQGNYAMHRNAPTISPATPVEAFVQDLPPGDSDEPYDAADFNNMFLSYMPTDQILGEAAPSFVRPAMVNWIINNREGSWTLDRVRQALVALQRSTMRPLPIQNDPSVPAVVSDRSAGVRQLDYSGFTGSNLTPGLNGPIDYNSTSLVTLRNRMIELALALGGRDDDGDGIIDSWDVDNNGDGVVDSVWMDAGLPLTENERGELVKPLVAYLVEDLGGRVNINLAGTMNQARNIRSGRAISGDVQHTPTFLIPASSPGSAPGLVFTDTLGNVGDVSVSGLPQGWGYGPAEIDVRRLFPSYGTFSPSISPGAPLSNFFANDFIRGPQRLLADRSGMLSRSRGWAGSIVDMDDAAYSRIFAAPGHWRDPVTDSGNDYVGMLRNANRPNTHVRNIPTTHPQGLPVDAHGRSTFGLSSSGDLVIAGASTEARSGGLLAGDALDDPYEMDMGATSQPDAPYTLADLEPLLNYDSLDRSLLSNRLISLVEDFHNNGTVGTDVLDRLRRALADSMTVSSNSVATVRGGLPSEFFENTAAATSASSPQTVFEVSLGASLAAQARNAILWELMPESLRAGRKLDLNTKFGNGFDDDGDFVIDDDQNGVITPAGVSIPEVFQLAENHYLGTGGVTTPHSSAGSFTHIAQGEVLRTPVGSRNVSPRALFARHLYVMAMVLIRDANRDVAFDFPHTAPIPPGYDSRFIPGTATTAAEQQDEFAQEYRAWKVAQWAVNVADFRDDDAVMTRFDYDPNPFDGWDVDLAATVNLVGPTIVLPTYRTVWGLEFPELSLEESLAFHDRRVRDTDQDNAGSPDKSLNGTNGMATRGDDDMDQYLVPEGSLFLELRNTRGPQPWRVPADEADDTVNTMNLPREIYTRLPSGQWALNLGAMTPGPVASQVPVWRVAISEVHSPAAISAKSALVSPSSTEPDTSPYYEGAPDYLLQPVGSGAIAAAASLPTPIAVNRDTATLQPEMPDFLDDRFNHFNANTTATYALQNAQRRRAIDRVVFFANGIDPANMVSVLADVYDEGQVFYNRVPSGSYSLGGVFVEPGQHVVIGPRATTHFGINETDAAGATFLDPNTGEFTTPPTDTSEFWSRQKIELFPNSIAYTDLSDTSQTPIFDGTVGPVVNASIRPIVGIQAAADPPPVWATATTSGATDRVGAVTGPIGLNVSEPLPYNTPPAGRSYYTKPTHELDTSVTNAPLSYIDYDQSEGALPDLPFDANPAMSELYRAFGPAGQLTGTHEHFKTAYLQRLADPTQPYNAIENPYITLDYITIDLTVFNGTDDNNRSLQDMAMNDLWVDDADPDPFGAALPEKLASRYKTGKSVTDAATTVVPEVLAYSVNTFPPEVTTPTAYVAAAPYTPYFPIALHLDPAVVADATSNSVGLPTDHSTTLGYANASYGERWQQGTSAYTPGSPSVGQATPGMMPFIGLSHTNFITNVTWLNRPFVSPYELMWVPTSGPGRFTFEFGSALSQIGSDQFRNEFNQVPVSNAPTTAPPPIPPALPTAKTPADPSRYDFNQRFTHLWNYFGSSNNVFAYEPETFRTGGTTTGTKHPWLPGPPVAPDFVGLPVDSMDSTQLDIPAMRRPYSSVEEKWPSPNFWRLLEWVEVPPPFDFETDFVSAELDPLIAGAQPLFGPRFDMTTFGPIGTVDADPRSWTNVDTSTMTWNRASGSWIVPSTPPPGSYSGFWTNDVAMNGFRPPFGFRSGQFRNGLVNLNTIKSVRVYKALMSGFSTAAELDDTIGNNLPAGTGAFFDEFLRTRRGYTPDTGAASRANNWFERGGNPIQTFDHDDNTGTAELASFDRNIPTQFAGVFKSAMGGVIAPLESMRTRPINPDDSSARINDPAGTFDPIEREAISPIQSTLLRGDVDRNGTNLVKPAFERLAEPTPPESHTKSPIHKNLGITRLANMATDQSNVFAVWITVGYFNVDAETMSVGEEAGISTGEIRRPKGFFIIDRSVPVMYEPGRLNNAMDTVKLFRINE
ncbi:hypothetical protein Pla22_32530 [Rubripirellula amarantea]|uniref:Uncharacterized protein n=1 Tax=Rubripirellula amarantea TaxID=2527999 RepID=A0A5C5WIQ8_9BACT|nr:hypothetical protein [Rubripirellula amarantea]TWT50510.1 hypothetical protein Pla22_32530 [Rubripirellula amarantea]